MLPERSNILLRHGVSDKEHLALHHYEQENPHLTQTELALYFERTFNHPIAQSNMSRILTAGVTRIEPAASKSQHHDREAWPELDKALYILYLT